MTDYRTRIYSRYASAIQNTGDTFDTVAAARWGLAFEYYLRGWLPEERDAAILDVACGDGKFLHFLKERGFTNLSGVDICPEQVRLASQVVPDVTEDSAIDFLEEQSRSFDLITGLDIIEHLKKDDIFRFLEGCFAALKPGGQLVLQTPNADSPWSSCVRYGDFTHEVCFNSRSLSSLMRMCGFGGIEIREQGPPPWGYSVGSSARYVVWRLIRLGIKFWNVAETGSAGNGVFTRVFMIKGERL
ncbi:MAG TPA: class I SAM-dependent methyltransferase [Desulfosporosinus sp.]|nr:class I SAM-dependent methyltransferase [Desulfosporosinus sp.]